MTVYHFLGFIMHQPVGNLLDLLNNSAEANQAKQILLAYQRAVEYAERYANVGQFCVCFSGTLLEQLQDLELIERTRDFIDIPRMLERYATAKNIELAGTGYYHPLFPLISEAHWADHIRLGRDKVIEVFHRAPKVFWPPELGFSCNMIPHLVAAGYQQVLCDGVHLRSHSSLTLTESSFRPHIAQHAGDSIVLIPRNGSLSNLQQECTDPDWFHREVLRQTKDLVAPILMTTCTDGENGGCFRNENPPSNFWGRLFAPCMDRVKDGNCATQPTSLASFLDQHPPDADVLAEADTGTWAYTDKSDPEGTSFDDWTRTPEQRQVLQELRDMAEEIVAAEDQFESDLAHSDRLMDAKRWLLQAEASDNFWKENPTWVWRSRKALARARELLEKI